MRQMGQQTSVVLDTNIFVAAGFRPNSDSARVLQRVRNGSLQLVWNQQTYQETRHILQKIPPLSWSSIAGLFHEENCYREVTHPENFDYVPDPDDRKFAALAAEAGVVLVSLDQHLLAGREQSPVPILTPSEFVLRYRPVQQEAD